MKCNVDEKRCYSPTAEAHGKPVLFNDLINKTE